MNAERETRPQAVAGSLSRSILSYSSALLLCQALGVTQGLIVIRLMEPAVLGVWLGLQLITIYGVHAHFGLLNAVNRQVPFYRGRNDPERAKKIENVVRGNVMLLAGICLVVLTSCWLAGLGSSAVGRGALALTLATAVNLGAQFYMGLFRARHEFGKAGIANVVNALVIFCGLPLVYYLDYDGLLLRALAAAAVTVLACVVLDGWSFEIEFDWRETLSLVRVGLPIMILSYGVVVFFSMDRTLILWFLDPAAMGQYALCFAVARLVRLFPNLIGQIFYPRMTESYASFGISRPLFRICAQATLLSTLISALVCAASYVVLPRLVDSLLPKYVEGVPALRVALIAYFLMSFSSGPNFFLISTVQKRRQFVVLLAAAGLMIVSAYVLADQALVGIAWSLVIGVAGYVAGLWAVVIFSVRGSK